MAFEAPAAAARAGGCSSARHASPGGRRTVPATVRTRQPASRPHARSPLPQALGAALTTQAKAGPQGHRRCWLTAASPPHFLGTVAGPGFPPLGPRLPSGGLERKQRLCPKTWAGIPVHRDGSREGALTGCGVRQAGALSAGAKSSAQKERGPALTELCRLLPLLLTVPNGGYFC